jgi:hypothetical protein
MPPDEGDDVEPLNLETMARIRSQDTLLFLIKIQSSIGEPMTQD